MKSINFKKTAINSIVFLALLSWNALAVDMIMGKVINTKNQPVEYATVALLHPENKQIIEGEVCNEKGEFLFEKVKSGDYILSVSMVGYEKNESEKVIVNANKNRVIEKSIVLKESTLQLNDVVVTAKKQFIEQTVDKMVINPEASITSASENVFEILKKLPGVSVDNNDNISLKGKQGVTVLIDDKPTYLSNTELATMLKSMLGKSVNKIEIIENPSARFDAEGNSGIINIKTKHNKAPGFNGSINGGISQASKLGENAGIDLNMNSGKINVYGNYAFYAWNEWHGLDASRRFTSPGLVGASQVTYNLSNYHGNGHNFKVGGDYYLAKNHVFSIMYRGNFGFNNNTENGSTVFKNILQIADSSLQTVTDRGHNWNNKTLNVNYKWDIDSIGQSLTFDADYARFIFKSTSNQVSANFDKFGNNVNRDIDLTSTQDGNIRIITAKADYVRPFSKIFSFESGLKASFVRTDNSATMNGYISQNDWFIYDENIQAAYVNGQLNLEKTSFQLGLRLENTNSIGRSISTNVTTEKSYLKLFPSFFAQQKLNKDNNINFRYSYRIGRPSYYALNPFVLMIDPFTYNQGNPLLKPQFTHSMGLTHSFKGILNTSIGYNYTMDLFSQVLFQNDATKAIYQTNENLSNSTDWNISETFQLEPAKWWRVNGTLTGMYKVVNANLGGVVQFENFNFMSNINNTFTINKFIGMELNGFYTSKQLNGNFIINPRYTIDFGVQCKLLDNKLTVKAAINDIFNSNHTNGYSKYNDIDLDFSNTNDSRQLNISVNYRFGKDDFKTRANRSTASSEEQSRSTK